MLRSSPCSVLGAAVDVGAVLQQHLDDMAPASRAGLVESCVTCVVTPIDLPHILLQTIVHHILQKIEHLNLYFPTSHNFADNYFIEVTFSYLGILR